MSAEAQAADDALPTDPETPIYIGRNRSNKRTFHLFADCRAFPTDSDPRETTLSNRPLRAVCCAFCERRYAGGDGE